MKQNGTDEPINYDGSSDSVWFVQLSFCLLFFENTSTFHVTKALISNIHLNLKSANSM
jgi:hypothetical protein